MVQTLTVWANGVAEINTGSHFVQCTGIPFTDALQAKIDAISSVISAAGVSQIHVERDLFREFEHLVVGGSVRDNPLGTTVSVADFDWIMQHINEEAAAHEAAAAAAIPVGPVDEEEPSST